MAILNIGSINIDRVFQVPTIPQPGETMMSTGYFVGLGGKGANQSVTIARLGGNVVHLGERDCTVHAAPCSPRFSRLIGMRSESAS